MRVSVVIATRDRRASLAATLAALAAVRVPLDVTWQLVVADNGSTDGTAELLASGDLGRTQLLRVVESRRGKAHALNAALRISRGDVIAFLDDDVRPDPSWLEEILRPFRTPGASAVTGAVRIAPALERPWLGSTHRAWLAETRPGNDGVGANLAIRREVLADVPEFDPELGPGALGLWEDTLFLEQIRAAGREVVCAEGAAVTHHFDASRLGRPAWLRHAAAQGRSEAYVAWHWEHRADHASLGRELALHGRLLTRRLRRRAGCPAPEWELDLLTGIAFERQWRRERRRRRAYACRGLVKLA